MILLCLLFTSSLSQAQTESTYLGGLEQTASTELKQATDRIAKILDTEKHGGPAGDSCELLALNVQKEYDQWFIDHLPRFQEYDRTLDLLLTDANDKLKSLSSQLPIQGVAEMGHPNVSISFGEIIAFFKILNQRKKACGSSPEKLEAFKKSLEFPGLLSDQGLTPAQIINFMPQMVKNLNANLQQQTSSYSIQFSEGDEGWDILFVINTKLDSHSVSYGFSVIKNWGSELTFSEENKWEAVVEAIPTLDGYPTDAYFRFGEFESKYGSEGCNKRKIIDDPAPRLYLSHQQVFSQTPRDPLRKGAVWVGKKIKLKGTQEHLIDTTCGLYQYLLEKGAELEVLETTHKEVSDALKSSKDAIHVRVISNPALTGHWPNLASTIGCTGWVDTSFIW